MSSSSVQIKLQLRINNFINKQKIRMNMTFAIAGIITSQCMVSFFKGKRLLVFEKFNYLKKLFNITVAFDCFFVIFFELRGIENIKHPAKPLNLPLFCKVIWLQRKFKRNAVFTDSGFCKKVNCNRNR